MFKVTVYCLLTILCTLAADLGVSFVKSNSMAKGEIIALMCDLSLGSVLNVIFLVFYYTHTEIGKAFYILSGLILSIVLLIPLFFNMVYYDKIALIFTCLTLFGLAHSMLLSFLSFAA